MLGGDAVFVIVVVAVGGVGVGSGDCGDSGYWSNNGGVDRNDDGGDGGGGGGDCIYVTHGSGDKDLGWSGIICRKKGEGGEPTI